MKMKNLKQKETIKQEDEGQRLNKKSQQDGNEKE
jgi:hypothetical protein